ARPAPPAPRARPLPPSRRGGAAPVRPPRDRAPEKAAASAHRPRSRLPHPEPELEAADHQIPWLDAVRERTDHVGILFKKLGSKRRRLFRPLQDVERSRRDRGPPLLERQTAQRLRAAASLRHA